jgi:cell division septum initiation protein DivIVA
MKERSIPGSLIQAAKQEVDRLRNELAGYANRVDHVAQAVGQPDARAAAEDLANRIRSSQATAADLTARLGSNVAMQRELMSGSRARIQSSEK